MIPIEKIPELQALWAAADAAFRADDAYLLDMCDGIVDLMMRRERAERRRAEAAAVRRAEAQRQGHVGGAA